MLLDVLAIVLALCTALLARMLLNDNWESSFPWESLREVAPLVCLVTLLLFARAGLYAARPTRPGLVAIISILFQVTLVVLVYSLVEGTGFSSYFVFYGGLGFAVLYVVLLRAIYDRLAGLIVAWALGGSRTVVVGLGQHADATARRLSPKVPASGADPGVIRTKAIDAEALGQLEQRYGTIRSVVIGDPSSTPVEPLRFAAHCHERGIRFRIAASTNGPLQGHFQVTADAALPMLEFRPPLLDGLGFYVKRLLDVVMATLLGLLLMPLMALIALSVRCSSPGPAIYRSTRPGLGGWPFACLKFRTMRADADGLQGRLEDQNERQGALFKIDRDPRITKVGKLLRRSSLDELPQIINVLRGEMSLVGPRPLPTRDFELLAAHHRRRYLVLPGMTGLWQVGGRSDLGFEEMVTLDLFYIENWSVWLDLVVLLRTVPAVLRARGAY
jgi:exopolysaccharide biosynthesis polyprenyl glycosylphosphotransferase